MLVLVIEKLVVVMMVVMVVMVMVVIMVMVMTRAEKIVMILTKTARVGRRLERGGQYEEGLCD